MLCVHQILIIRSEPEFSPISQPLKLTKMHRLMNDDIFTFIVGPQRAVIRVHVSILKTISEPLAYMMTNGKMDESLKREAILADNDPEVFAHLLKFAYRGLYAISDGTGCL